jgi:hypothetical protein
MKFTAADGAEEKGILKPISKQSMGDITGKKEMMARKNVRAMSENHRDLDEKNTTEYIRIFTEREYLQYVAVVGCGWMWV